MSFLQSVAGYAQVYGGTSSADKPMRLAVIDPAWTGGAPKVTFEGESTMSTKQYTYLESYYPTASERVVLAPIGTTYIILGAVDGGLAVNNLVQRVAALELSSQKVKDVGQVTASATTSLTTSNVDITGGALPTFTTVNANAVGFFWASFDFSTTAAGTGSDAVCVGTLAVDGSDLVAPLAVSDRVSVNRQSAAQTYRVVFASAGSHNVKLRSRVTGSGGTSRALQTQTTLTGILLDYP
jgi:hypothetical protein